eukprot:29743-Pelagococcus_subviridis.AAC.1
MGTIADASVVVLLLVAPVADAALVAPVADASVVVVAVELVAPVADASVVALLRRGPDVHRRRRRLLSGAHRGRLPRDRRYGHLHAYGALFVRLVAPVADAALVLDERLVAEVVDASDGEGLFAPIAHARLVRRRRLMIASRRCYPRLGR